MKRGERVQTSERPAEHRGHPLHAIGRYSLTALLIMVAVVASLSFAPLAIFLAASLCLLTVAASRPHFLAPLLLVGSALFSRPNTFGYELAPLALAMVTVAASITLIRHHKRLDRLRIGSLPLLALLALSYLAVVVPGTLAGDASNHFNLLKGFSLTIGTLVGAGIVLSDRAQSLATAKLFTGLLVVTCGSYVVTGVVWLVAGVAAGQISMLTTGATENSYPVFFPFTVTVGASALPDGTIVPRFSGIGREPGWMGMYTAFAYFLAPRIGWTQWWVRALLVVGLAGTLSTAAFAIFVVLVAADVFFRSHGRSARSALIWRLAGVAGLCTAIAVAIWSPFLGLGAKAENDQNSYSARTDSTLAGVNALLTDPFSGQQGAETAGALNLIAAIAAYGLFYSLIVALAVWAPWLLHPAPQQSMMSVAVIFATLLLAQPSLDSSWAYVALMIAYSATMPARGQSILRRDYPPDPTQSVLVAGHTTRTMGA